MAHDLTNFFLNLNFTVQDKSPDPVYDVRTYCISDRKRNRKYAVCLHSQPPYQAGLWIRIGSGFRDFVDPDPYWESGSGSRGKKTKKFQWKKLTF
jgi:hypothetical protein